MSGSGAQVSGRCRGEWDRFRAPLLSLLLSGLAGTLWGCGPSDPAQQVLEERRRWEVEIVGWTQDQDAVQASIRVAGPVRAKLRTLTVRIDLVDASGETIEEVWRPLDVSQASRGAPAEVFVSIPTESEVDGLAVTVVGDPSPEQSKKIVELTGVRSCNLFFRKIPAAERSDEHFAKERRRAS